MKKVVLISGHICTGKSALTRRLGQQFGFHLMKTSTYLSNVAPEMGFERNRIGLQNLGDKLDIDTRGKWVLDLLSEQIAARAGTANFVVDAVRIPQQVEHVRSKFGLRVVHVHLTAPIEELERRFEERKSQAERRERDALLTFAEANLNKTEKDVESLREEADLCIDTSRCDADDVLVRVAARMGLYAPPSLRCVDVLVGGQFGSEGKGHISAYLAREYDVVVRVGGPNAGHTVISSESGKTVYHHLPSGCRDTNSLIIIGPGAVINWRQALQEKEKCAIRDDRLKIDPQAMIIGEEDLVAEQALVNEIGSTGRGVGAATARKIMSRLARPAALARDIDELAPFIARTADQLESAYVNGKKILLEGTQGSGLSIHHGQYPYVTSRDTNVSGCLAEAGISPNRVRRVIMVIRPYPIRVANPPSPGMTSGRLKQEITVDVIAKRAGLDPERLRENEKTTTTRKNRRFGEFEWDQFRQACALNAPTDIALSFADYILEKNRRARRFDQLTQETIMFVEEIERVAQAPVSLINTRFDPRSVIDRRDWISP